MYHTEMTRLYIAKRAVVYIIYQVACSYRTSAALLVLILFCLVSCVDVLRVPRLSRTIAHAHCARTRRSPEHVSV